MIAVKVKLTVRAGVEREVFASCGAIVRALLQDAVEEAVRDAVRDHGASVPLRITVNLGTLRWATWKSDFASMALAALRRRSFTVKRVCLNGTEPSTALCPSIMHTSVMSSRRQAADHRNAIGNVVRGGRDHPSVFKSGADADFDADAVQAVPQDGIVALADFLEKGHFTGPLPWADASPAAWFAGALDGDVPHIVNVLKNAVTQPLRYTRLRNAVGAPLAARIRALCDARLDRPSPMSPEPGPALRPAKGASPRAAASGAARAAYPSVADASIRRMSVNGDDARLDRPSSMSPELRPALRPAQRASPRGRTSGAARPAESDVIVVTNAGLICLWPLIPAFLAALALRPGPARAADVVLGAATAATAAAATATATATAAATDAATDAADDMQIRVSAAIALDYLVWGDPAWREWRMPLNKLVCGLAQEALIDAPVLDEGSKAKIDAWLHALPSRVPGLGHCGVSDLRQLFLQRGGKLVSENARWRIVVDADASDVLLDPLPWPLQQAVFPWLTAPIEVMWR